MPTSPRPIPYGYRIKDKGDHWSWAIVEPDGAISLQGRAASKAVAAACVIRHLIGKAEPKTVRSAA